MILVFDLETTGLGFKSHIVQIAWELFDYNKTLVNQKDYIIRSNGASINEESVKINGITREIAWKFGRDLSEVLLEFKQDLKKADLIVGHNLEFDYNVLLHEIKVESAYEAEGDSLSYKYNFVKICTMLEGADYLTKQTGQTKYPKLSELYYSLFKVEMTNAHNAKFDVHYTSECFWKMVDLKLISIPQREILKEGPIQNLEINNWFSNLSDREKIFIIDVLLPHQIAREYYGLDLDSELKFKFLPGENKPKVKIKKEFIITEVLEKKLITMFLNTKELEYSLSTFDILKNYLNIESLLLGTVDYEYNTHYVTVEKAPDLTVHKKLKKLDISLSCNNLKSLANLKSLEELGVSGYELTDLTGIETLINLKRLTISFKSKIKTLEPLRDLLNLEDIFIKSTELSNIDAIIDLPKLKTVGIGSGNTNCMNKFKELLIDKHWELRAY